MGAALALTLALFSYGLAGAPGLALGLGATLQDRLVVAAAAGIGPLTTLAAVIGVVANRRFFSADDIDGAGLTTESAAVRIPRAILANTLEQAVLALGVYGGLALVLPAGQLALPLLLGSAFLGGRTLFAFGYAHGAAARSMGFALTFYPTVGGLVTLVLRLIAIGRA
ncbi:MAG: MAPEG family protein [Caulobacterales bacterium]